MNSIKITRLTSGETVFQGECNGGSFTVKLFDVPQGAPSGVYTINNEELEKLADIFQRTVDELQVMAGKINGRIVNFEGER